MGKKYSTVDLDTKYVIMEPCGKYYLLLFLFCGLLPYFFPRDYKNESFYKMVYFKYNVEH